MINLIDILIEALADVDRSKIPPALVNDFNKTYKKDAEFKRLNLSDFDLPVIYKKIASLFLEKIYGRLKKNIPKLNYILATRNKVVINGNNLEATIYFKETERGKLIVENFEIIIDGEKIIKSETREKSDKKVSSIPKSEKEKGTKLQSTIDSEDDNNVKDFLKLDKSLRIKKLNIQVFNKFGPTKTFVNDDTTLKKFVYAIANTLGIEAIKDEVIEGVGTESRPLVAGKLSVVADVDPNNHSIDSSKVKIKYRSSQIYPVI